MTQTLKEYLSPAAQAIPITPSSLLMVNDMVSLPELNEAVILHLLKTRYEEDSIYVCYIS